jgi:hypothetical protein
MKILRLFGLCLSAAACMMFATGCMSMRFATTLPPSGDRDRSLGLVKVNITNVVVSSPAGYGNIVPDMARKDFMAAAREQYPLIFDEDRNALPVNVEVSCEYDDYHERALRYALLTVLSVGIVPSLEYLRGERYVGVPGVAIGSDGAIASVAVYSHRPIDRVR